MASVNPSLPPAGPTLVASTASELLLRLYSEAYGRRGEIMYTPSGPQLVSEEHETALEWFFGDESALSNNLAAAAATEGWLRPDTMIEALRQRSTTWTVCTLLGLTSATPAEIRRRNQMIGQLINGRSDVASELIAQSVADGFEAASVSRLLAEPEQGVQALVKLLDDAAERFVDEGEVRARLEARAEVLRAQFAATTDLRSELSRATGGWTLADPEGYNIVLAPSEAIHPYIIHRMCVGDSAIVLFSSHAGAGRDLADLAEAFKVLGNVQRLTILRMVVDAPKTGQELAKLLGLSEATIHHHTTALRSSGLITSEREAHRLYHRTTPESLHELMNDLRRVLFENS